MNKSNPIVSVVIPALNEATMLPACLQSLIDQDFSASDFEIIVVDNNSSDITPKLAKTYGARVIFESSQGVSYARQAGFKAAHGQFILSTDADTVVPTNWISQIVDKFTTNPHLIGLSGPYDFINTNTLLKLITKALTPLAHFIGKQITSGLLFNGSNMAVRKKYFDEVGGFNAHLKTAEDYDLGLRLKKMGTVKYFNNIKVKTSARRFGVGISTALRYVSLFLFFWKPKVSEKSSGFSPIREQPFYAFDTISELPITIPLIIILIVVIVFLVGFTPNTNLWSTSHLKTSDRLIALTFDDGPNEPYTSQILQILKEKSIHATFFVVGENVQRYPKTVQAAYTAGNQIGNHSVSHQKFLMLHSGSQIVQNLTQSNDIINEVIGKKPKFFRPPHGFRTIWGAKAISSAGFETVTWNDMTTDWNNPSSKKITVNIIRHANPGGIIVLHDGAENRSDIDHSNTVKATAEIIDLLQAEGYEFVTLETLLGKQAYF